MLTAKEHKKLTDDAVYLVSSLAMAAARTTVARRAADDALNEENRLTAALCDAIKALSAACPSVPNGSEAPK